SADTVLHVAFPASVRGQARAVERRLFIHFCLRGVDMDAFARRRLGRSSLEVTRLGFGGASLGDAYEVIPETQAEGVLEAAFAAGIGYFDTSPWYGNGKSEMRFGRVLRTKPRSSFVLTTKVGRVYFRPQEPDTFHHSRWVG